FANMVFSLLGGRTTVPSTFAADELFDQYRPRSPQRDFANRLCCIETAPRLNGIMLKMCRPKSNHEDKPPSDRASRRLARRRARIPTGWQKQTYWTIQGIFVPHQPEALARVRQEPSLTLRVGVGLPVPIIAHLQLGSARPWRNRPRVGWGSPGPVRGARRSLR